MIRCCLQEESPRAKLQRGLFVEKNRRKTTVQGRDWKIVSLVLLLLLSSSSATTDNDNDGSSSWKAKVDDESQSSLFKPSSYIKVSGPTIFPKPTRKVLSNQNNKNSNEATTTTTTTEEEPIPIVKPVFGRHRPNKDAVFAYAEGYALPVYMMFIETLKSTGYKGDVVLAIADQRIIQPNVIEYLWLYALPKSDDTNNDDRLGVVVYQVPLYCKNTNDDGTNNGERRVMRQGGTDVFQQCQLNDVYGWKDKDGNTTAISCNKILIDKLLPLFLH